MKFHQQPTLHVKSAQPGMRQQRGVVLFVALIALVVMALAAVALIRSVDTGTLIAGNLSAKQSATTSADSGMETAMSWITANPALLSGDDAAQGYYATSAGDAKVLVNASTVKATGDGIVDGKDSSGNTITYVIQRMCRDPGPADAKDPATGAANCLLGPVSEDPCKKRNPPDPFCKPERGVLYRITIRSTGPKNTVSYAQAFVY